MRLLHNLEMKVSEQDTPALDSNDHTSTPTTHMVRRERLLRRSRTDVSVDTYRVHFEEYCHEKFSESKSERNTSKIIRKEREKRIVNFLRGDPVALAYLATFKFWVKKQGFEVLS